MNPTVGLKNSYKGSQVYKNLCFVGNKGRPFKPLITNTNI